MTTGDTYNKLISLLDRNNRTYRLIDHPPEGKTDLVSALRGHDIATAAKCIVLIVKLGKKVTRFVLAVVPGDTRVDTGKIRSLLGATYVGFAAADVAERLADCVAGTVLPFVFHPDLTLIVDPSLRDHVEIFSNATRLDGSVALRTVDYLTLAKPCLERIASPDPPATADCVVP
jgi:Ala-tRNA(Pro) deacylase